MTKVLLVAATEAEIAPFFARKNAYPDVDVLISGVGMVATAVSVAKKLGENSYDLAVQAGIAGSFRRVMAPGDVFRISSDCFPELGAEDGDAFIPIETLGFGEGCTRPLKPFSPRIFAHLSEASAITVNTVHGDPVSIGKLLNRLSPDLESMEGAAFFQACAAFAMPCLQIRAVSNYVERRNRENWNIGLAVKNLNDVLENLIAGLPAVFTPDFYV